LIAIKEETVQEIATRSPERESIDEMMIRTMGEDILVEVQLRYPEAGAVLILATARLFARRLVLALDEMGAE
jgi:hypothetical protein